MNRPQQVHRALVEPEVVDRADDLAVLDQVDAVAGQPGEQQASAGRPRGCTTGRSAAGRARSPATRSSGAPAAPSTSQDQVVDRRRDAAARSARRSAGSAAARVSSPSRIQSVRAAAGRCRRPTASRRRRRGATTNGAHSEPGVGRVGVQRQRLVGRAARRSGCRRRGLEKTVRPSCGVPGAGAPVDVDHQVGDRGRRQQRLVAAGRAGRPGARPSRAAGELGVQRVRVHVGEVAGGAADPGAGRQVGGLAGAAEVAGRLVVPQPQPGRRAEVGRGRPRGRRSRTAAGPPRRPGRTPRRARARSRRTRRSRSSPGRSSQSADGVAGDQRRASSAGPRRRAARVGRRDQARRPGRRSTRCADTEPAAAPWPAPSTAITVTATPCIDAVGGQGVARPAQVGAGASPRR